MKEALNALVLKVSTKLDLKGPLEYQEESLEHLIHVQEGPIQPFPLVSWINGMHGKL